MSKKTHKRMLRKLAAPAPIEARRARLDLQGVPLADHITLPPSLACRDAFREINAQQVPIIRFKDNYYGGSW
jgi:hypothetical protein